MSDEVSMPVSSVEMQEYLFAQSLGKIAAKCEKAQNGVTDFAELRHEIRVCFRYHRFGVMNWLLMNGVSIPASLLTDQSHPAVGMQFPDRSVK